MLLIAQVSMLDLLRFEHDQERRRRVIGRLQQRLRAALETGQLLRAARIGRRLRRLRKLWRL